MRLIPSFLMITGVLKCRIINLTVTCTNELVITVNPFALTVSNN